MPNPSLLTLRTIQQCLHSVPVNPGAADAKEALRSLADAIEWVEQAIAAAAD